MALADYQALVDAMVRDDEARITTSERDAALASAVTRYSEDRPRRVVVDLVAAGGHLLDLPAGWEAAFSQVVGLEYPIGEVPPAEIPTGAWRIYATPAGETIQVDDSFAAGAEVRCTHTASHALAADADTIPVKHRDPVAAWAASLLLDQLAALAVNAGDPTIAADAVDHRSKSQEYAARARACRKRYFDTLGVNEKRNAAAGVVVDLDLADSLGRDRLTHPARYR